MFNSQSLSRNGPLGAVWLAAYCHKRLKKLHVTQTDIPSSVDKMLHDEVDVITYRVLAYFLIGIVRIYSKKVEYLFKDCHKVLIEVKGFVLKEPNSSHTKTRTRRNLESHGSVSIPKRFELDAFDLEVVEEECNSRSIDKPLEEITLRDHNWGDLGAAQSFTGMHQWQDLTTCCHPSSPGHFPSEDALQSDMAVDEVGIISDVVVDEVGRVHDTMDDQAERVSLQEDKEMSVETFRNCIPDQGEGSYLSTLGRFEESFPNPLNEDDQVNGEETADMEGLLMKEEKPMEVEEPERSVNQEKRDLPEEIEDDRLFDVAEEWPLELVNTPGKEPVARSGSLETDESPERVSINKNEIPLVSSSPQLLVDQQGTIKPETIPTPKIKEHVLKKRKRLSLCDDTTVLSNKEIKRNLADPSGLACRRKTVPQNAIVAWKASRIRNISMLFSEPMISGMSPDLMFIFRPPVSNTPEITEVICEVKDTQDVVGELEKSNIPESPVVGGLSTEPKGLAPVTPAQQRPLSRKLSESPVVSNLDATRAEPIVIEQELEFPLNIEEIAPCEGDNQEPNGTTERTRTVANFMHGIFLKLKKGAEDEVLSLSKVSKGKTRKYSARFFYEILVLKSKGCIIVEQQCPYDDIMIRKGSELDQTFRI